MHDIILLFSYGTLQLKTVQLETFGRELVGSEDELVGFSLGEIEITDPEVIRSSGKQFHPIIRYSGDANDRVRGKILEITSEELLQSDRYEVADYKRVVALTKSGKYVNVYIAADDVYS